MRRALAAIERDDPRLGCFIDVDAGSALAAARASDDRQRAGRLRSPLDGLIFAVKANIALAGLGWSAGIAARRTVVASEDAWAVARLRERGAIPVGTTNLAEGALGATTNNVAFGVTRNPADPERNAGGSSGGSACAVSAGMADFALGTDTLGSVRIPAAYCGIAGWKPSRGAIDLGGVVPLCSGFDTVGVLAPRVADIAPIAEELGVQHVSGAQPATDAILPAALLEQPLDAAVRDGFETALEDLERLGCRLRIHRGELPNLESLRRACLLRCEVEAARFYRSALSENPAGFSDRFRSYLEYGSRAGAQRLAAADRTIDRSIEQFAQLFSGNAVVVLPTTPHIAPAAESDGPDDAADFTGWVNAMGGCAISVPAHRNARGSELPAGVQIVGRRGSDANVIALGMRLEAARA